MKVLIVEDEMNNANLLKHELTKLDEAFEIMDVLDSVEATVNYLKKDQEPVDLIFMDVRLNDGYAFEIFDKVQTETPVIFITAYDEYAIEAFKANSVSYLMKPVDAESLRTAIDKYKLVSRHYNKPANGIKKERLIVRKGSSKASILISDVAFFYSEMRLSFAIDFSSDRYFLDTTLNQLEEVVEPKEFFRATRQLLINIKAIKEFKSIEFSKMELTLIKNNWIKSPVAISQFTAPAFKRWIENL